MSTKIALKQLSDEILDLLYGSGTGNTMIAEYAQNTEYKKDTLVYRGDRLGRVSADFTSDNTQTNVDDSFTLDLENDKIVLVSGGKSELTIEIIDSIDDIVAKDVIYLVPDDDAKENNIYDEYMLINGKPELIGNTKIDLTDYATKEYVDDLIDDAGAAPDKTYSSNKIESMMHDPYTLPIATSAGLGGVKIGDNIDIDGEGKISVTFPDEYELPEASDSELGGIILGEGLEKGEDGKVNVVFPDDYVLPVASNTELGGIKVGNNLTIDPDGTLNALASGSYDLPIASDTTLGGIKVGDNLSIDSDGVLSALASGEMPVAQYEANKEYKKDTLVYHGKYLARVEVDFDTNDIDPDIQIAWENEIKDEHITVMNTDHMHLMVEYAQENYYTKDLLVYLGDLIGRVLVDFTADDLEATVEDSFDKDIAAGHILILNKEAEHSVVAYKRGTFYDKDKLVWGDGRICRATQDFTSDTTSGKTLAESIKLDMQRGYLEELGEKYKFKLYFTTKDLDKTINAINTIPVSTIQFEGVDTIDIMRVGEGVYGPLGTLSIITEIDKNNKIIKTKSVNSREMEFMPPAPNTIVYTVVTQGSGYAVGDIVRTTNHPNEIFGEVEEVDIGGGLIKVKQSDATARNTNGSGGDVTADRVLYMGNGKEWYEHHVTGANAVMEEYVQGQSYETNNLVFFGNVLTRAAHDFTANSTLATTQDSFLDDIQNGHLIRLTNEEVSVPECLGAIKTDKPEDLPALPVKGNWVLVQDCEINAPGQAGIALYNGTSWDITPIPQGEFQFPEPNDNGKLYFRKRDTGNQNGIWEQFTTVDGNEIEVTIKRKGDLTDGSYVPKAGELVWDTDRQILVVGDGSSTLGSLDAFYGSSVSSSDILAAIGYVPEDKAEKGMANGYAPLGANGKVPDAYLPDAAVDTYSKAEIDQKDSDTLNAATALVNSEASRAQTIEGGLRSDLDGHISDASMHVTQGEKDYWNSKVDDADLDPYTQHVQDNTIHVTQEQKDKWDGMNQAYFVSDVSQLPLTGNQVGNIGYVEVSSPGAALVVCDQYIWDGSSWRKMDASQVSLSFTWGNIQGRPSSSVLSIDNAVTVAHNHLNKLVLDKIGQSVKGNFMYDGVEIGVKAIFVDHEQELPDVGDEDTLYVVYEDSRVRNYPSISVYRDNAYQILGRGAQETAPAVGDMNILQSEYFSVVAGSQFKITVTPNQYFAFMPLEILREIPGATNQNRLITDFTDESKFKYNSDLITITPMSRLIINIKEIPATLKTVSDKYYHTAEVDLSNYKDIDSIG